MIQRSGLSARNFSPISAATSRTCWTTFLSSVSGMVKNCGACGSIAPPTIVDIIGSLSCSFASAHSLRSGRSLLFLEADSVERLFPLRGFGLEHGHQFIRRTRKGGGSEVPHLLLNLR